VHPAAHASPEARDEGADVNNAKRGGRRDAISGRVRRSLANLYVQEQYDAGYDAGLIEAEARAAEQTDAQEEDNRMLISLGIEIECAAVETGFELNEGTKEFLANLLLRLGVRAP
jgi:hypothetical protein